MDPGPTEDGSLWAKPARSRGRRQVRKLLMVAGVTLLIVTVVVQLMSYVNPRRTTQHGEPGVHIYTATNVTATLQ